MNKFIPTFIINNNEDFEKHIRENHFYSKANVIFFKNSKDFIDKYAELENEFQFRLLLHPELNFDKPFESNHFLKIKTLLNVFESYNEFKEISFPLLTRSGNIVSKCFANKTNYVINEGYTFFDASRIGVLNFLDDIPIMKKENSSLKVVNNIEQESYLIEKIDYAIITALYYDELEEIKVAFNLTNKDEFIFGTNAGYKFEFNGKKIIAVSQDEMGMVDSAILSTEIMLRFSPNFIIMPGVCGGDEKTEFGDIIMSKKVHLFQTGKLTDEGIEIESAEVKIDKKTKKLIEQNQKEIVKEIHENISDILKSDNEEKKKIFLPFKENKISFYPRPTACSTMVIDKKDFFEELKKNIDRKMIAIEMEGYGMARASEHLGFTTKSLMIKCVMDKTTKKEDIAKPYAAYISAQFVKKLIEKNILE